MYMYTCNVYKLQLQTDFTSRIMCSASPTSVHDSDLIRSATTSAFFGRRTKRSTIDYNALAAACCRTSCLEQPVGGRAVVHIAAAVPASPQV